MRNKLMLKIQTMDWEKVLNNALIFLAPAALIFLLAVQSGTPLKQALLVVETWAINTAVDLIRKFIAANPQ